MASSPLEWLIPRLPEDWCILKYGTAWKQDHTKRLVKEALAQGIRHIDTAAQPKHYREDLVGEAIREAFEEGILKREDLFLQTKFTPPAGQEFSNMPYDLDAPLETQIHASVASSLKNLRHLPHHIDGIATPYIDCLFLHSRLATINETLQAWRVLESYVPDKISYLGISNVSCTTLEWIWKYASVKPKTVQNRFYAKTFYDKRLRHFCRVHDIEYQAFWTLTGNLDLLKSGEVAQSAEMANIELEAALYALLINEEIIVLNGTTSSDHLRTNIEGIRKVSNWSRSHPNDFARIAYRFGDLLSSIE